MRSCYRSRALGAVEQRLVQAVVVSLLLAASTGARAQANEEASPLSLGEAELVLEEQGLRFDVQSWDWNGRSGVIWRVRVPLDASVRVIPSSTVVPLAELVPSEPGPWALINGAFYDEALEALGLVVGDGTEHSPLARGGGSGVFMVGSDGPRVVHRDDWVPGPAQALQSIARLVVDGSSVVRSRNQRLASRAAVALSSEHLWLVAAVENDSLRPVDAGTWLRWTARRGLPLWVFADLVVASTGATQALNLDGGGSVNLRVQGSTDTHVVRGERGTINAILVSPGPSTARAP